MQSGFQGKVWIFDLDNTLHDAGYYIYPQINRLMTLYIVKYLNVDFDKATYLRQKYWERYGATIIGLIKHHKVDPHHFLAATHDFRISRKTVSALPRLKHILKAIRGKKYLYSNAPYFYIKLVLHILRISSLFVDVFSIESTKFNPKPCLRGFHRVLGKRRLQPAGCIMVEDTLENLRTAKLMGMKTIWVNPGVQKPSWVDARISHIGNLVN